MWSYFPGWAQGGAPAAGNPPNCALQTIEVGARNPSAPPWEGRLVPFGSPDASLTDVRQANDHIQEALIAMRPYGATPLAGMLADARHYLLDDVTHGSANDPYYQGGCRKTFVILLSDGEPNLDLRPECETGDGKCPFDKPYEVAHALATNPDANKRVKTYAVGFGLSSAAGTSCKALTQSDLTDPAGKCASATGALRACCTLGRIAFEGGTSNAYYADDLGSLKSVLSQVLSGITAGSTSRTLPIFAGATATAQGGVDAAGFQFLSSFDVPEGGALWTGNLERKRYRCETQAGEFQAWLQDIDEAKGDRFDANVNLEDPARPRRFFTVIGDRKPSGEILSRASIRPKLLSNDGLGLYSGQPTGNGSLLAGAAFAASIKASPTALEIGPGAPPSDCNARLKTTDPGLCAERVVRWEIGESNQPAVQESRQRSAACPSCSELGSIYHATPVTVGPPSGYLRDPSYSLFAAQAAKRPLMLYAATTDGQLHAFKVAPGDPSDAFKVDALANNELWSFIPPHVLPRILPTYNQQALLLDGAPVVRDVIFERSETQAIAGGGPGGATWNTVLLAGGGVGGGFYYALDITDPSAPRFLWQLATSEGAAPVPLFGKATPTPAIATVALRENGNTKEVAVAILPGGSAPQKAGTCPRKASFFPHLKPKGSFAPRASVRCWGEPGSPAGEVGPARSLTIARLDTGEVIMNFRGAAGDGPAGLGARSKIVDFDSPLSGIPVPYPAQVGSVADRIYIGDSDGTLWRVNLTSLNPQDWSVELAWDAYSFAGDAAATAEPIQTPPVVSTDAVGNPVILFSTGDQDLFTTNSVKTRVWSITERAVGSDFLRTENWVIPFEDGKRVTGAISLFDSVAYFATYSPPVGAGAACSYGHGSIWGVDYVKAWQDDPAQDPALPPYAASPYPQAKYACKQGDAGCAFPPGSTTAGYRYANDQPPGTTVFGVSVTQTPSCVETATFTDSFYGPYTAFSKTSQGDFQLVYQTGKGGAATEGAKTNTVTESLPPPKQLVRIDSWASVIE
jgi:type IV pilus assembly protein PilY1